MSGFQYVAMGLTVVLVMLVIVFCIALAHAQPYNRMPPHPRKAIHPEPPPMPKHKPSKQPPEFKIINTISHPCTVTVTSMGSSEYHITLSDTNG